MKTIRSFIPVLSKSRSSLFCTAALAVTTLLYPANTKAQAQVLSIGFETDEGFVTGDIDGQAGWATSTTTNIANIVNDYAYKGSQSLQISGTNNEWAGSPQLTTEGYHGVSFWVSNPDATPTANDRLFRFHVNIGEIIGGVDTHQTNMQFSISYQSDPNSANYTLYHPDGNTAITTTSFSKSFLDRNSWTELRFEMNKTDPDNLTYSFWIGGNEVLSGLQMHSSVTENSMVSRVQFRSHGDLTGASYYDNIVAIPEPSSLALLGGGALAGLVFLSRRRKKTAA